MRSNAKLFSFMAGCTLSFALSAENHSPSPLLPASCYTGVESQNQDADNFYLAGEEDSDLHNQEVEIEADTAEYQESGALSLEGDVVIQRPGYRASSHRAYLDQNSGHAELEGQVLLESPNLNIQGSEASINLTEREAHIKDARFLNPQSRLRGEAISIHQEDENLVVLEQGMFTTCAPDDASWKIRASEVILGQERGYGEAWHSRFEVLDVPVLYLPYFRFPIDNRRKSGFLYPTFGSSNTGEGVFVSTPYYLNLAPEFDATVTPSFIGGRGLHSELEFRHLTRFSHSEIGFGYLKKDESFKGEQQLLGNLSETGERWGFSFEQKYDFDAWDLPLFGSVDYSQVSDDDYLDDLNQGLRIENKDNLDRRAQFNFVQSNWQMDVVFQQYKSLDEDLPTNEEAYQRLPEINYQAFFYYDHWELDWRSQYVYFYRDADDLSPEYAAYGSRLRHLPRLSLPMRTSWGFLKPSFSLDHTDYELRSYTPQENHLSRTIPFFELDSGLFFDRETSSFENRYRHSLEPRLYYVYSPYKSQDAIPNFDTSLPSFSFQRLYDANRFSGGDRVSDNNRATLGLTNRWSDWETGMDRLVLSVGQVFHYERRRVEVDTTTDGSETTLGASDRKDSFLVADVLYRPTPEWEFRHANTWDLREDGTQESRTRLEYRAPKGGPVLNLGHRYREAEIEQSDASFILPVNERFSLLARWRYDLNSERTIGSLAGIEYNSCCWRLQLLTHKYLTDDSDIDSGVLLRLQLVGLGGAGANQEDLDDQIPGYLAREEYFR